MISQGTPTTMSQSNGPIGKPNPTHLGFSATPWPVEISCWGQLQREKKAGAGGGRAAAGEDVRGSGFHILPQFDTETPKWEFVSLPRSSEVGRDLQDH